MLLYKAVVVVFFSWCQPVFTEGSYARQGRQTLDLFKLTGGASSPLLNTLKQQQPSNNYPNQFSGITGAQNQHQQLPQLSDQQLLQQLRTNSLLSTLLSSSKQQSVVQNSPISDSGTSAWNTGENNFVPQKPPQDSAAAVQRLQQLLESQQQQNYGGINSMLPSSYGGNGNSVPLGRTPGAAISSPQNTAAVSGSNLMSALGSYTQNTNPQNYGMNNRVVPQQTSYPSPQQMSESMPPANGPLTPTQMLELIGQILSSGGINSNSQTVFHNSQSGFGGPMMPASDMSQPQMNGQAEMSMAPPPIPLPQLSNFQNQAPMENVVGVQNYGGSYGSSGPPPNTNSINSALLEALLGSPSNDAHLGGVTQQQIPEQFPVNQYPKPPQPPPANIPNPHSNLASAILDILSSSQQPKTSSVGSADFGVSMQGSTAAGQFSNNRMGLGSTNSHRSILGTMWHLRF